MSVGGSALVIGDPVSNFLPLPGTRDEARRVAVGLEQSGYRVRSLIQSGVEAVMMALHGDAYRMLHLAGQGVHAWPVAAPRDGRRPRLARGLPPLSGGPHAAGLGLSLLAGQQLLALLEHLELLVDLLLHQLSVGQEVLDVGA